MIIRETVSRGQSHFISSPRRGQSTCPPRAKRWDLSASSPRSLCFKHVCFSETIRHFQSLTPFCVCSGVVRLRKQRAILVWSAGIRLQLAFFTHTQRNLAAAHAERRGERVSLDVFLAICLFRGSRLIKNLLNSGRPCLCGRCNIHCCAFKITVLCVISLTGLDMRTLDFS